MRLPRRHPEAGSQGVNMSAGSRSQTQASIKDAPRGTYFVLQYRNCCKKREVLPHAAFGFGRAGLKDALCCSRGRDVRLKTAV
jgi:hypothetical protein